MLRKTFTIMTLASILAGAGHCYGGGIQNQPSGNPSGNQKLIRTLNEAKAKNKWLKIKLKDGRIIIGKVSRVSNNDFVIVSTASPFGVAAIQFAKVSSFKQQSRADRILDKIGGKTLTVLKWTRVGAVNAVAIPVGIPLFLIMWALGDLPPC
jgi:hypothetical protein